jgi:predicted secreted protein
MAVGTYQPGRSALIKYGTQTSPETYNTIGGLRNVDLTVDAGPVDVTNKDSGGFQTMLAGAGTWKGTVTGQGLFDSSSTLHNVLAKAHVAQALFYGQLVFGNGDTYTGQWAVRQYKRTGTYQDAETYDITLESSGTITFVQGT